MHLFKLSTLLYLSFHALAFVMLFVSVMGTPGNPDESKLIIKLILQIWSIFLVIAWEGLPYLLVGSLLAFFFHYDTIGKIISCISLGISTVLFLSVVLYYSLQS